MSWIAAFLATTAGKTAAGAVLAAAGLGGLHAADVVELPVLPDEASGPAEQSEDIEPAEVDDPVEVETTEAESEEAPEDLPEEAVAGQSTAAAKQDAAEAFTTAMQDWAECVATNAEAAQDGEVDEGFDPRAACDDRPQPGDFGLTDVPEQADDAATDRAENSDNGDDTATDARSNSDAGGDTATDGRSTGDAAREEQGDPTDGGSDTPAPDGAGSQDPSDRGENTPAPTGRP